MKANETGPASVPNDATQDAKNSSKNDAKDFSLPDASNPKNEGVPSSAAN